MSRKKLIAANWKMYKTPAEAKAFVNAFLPLVAGHTRDEIALFPSPVLLPAVTAACNASNVAVGAQNIHFAEEGAFTGETSVGQLIAVGGSHTLIGHSERRQYFAETDEIVNKKLAHRAQAQYRSHRLHRRSPRRARSRQNRERAQDPGDRRISRHHA